jgi:hypothetical protein
MLYCGQQGDLEATRKIAGEKLCQSKTAHLFLINILEKK